MTTSTARAGPLGALALATEVADELLLGTVRGLHEAVAARVHAATGRGLGPAAGVVRRVHDGVAGAVYDGLGRGLGGTAATLRWLDRHGVGPPVEASAKGRVLVSAVNGLIGDRLAEEQPELAVTLAVRQRGQDVPCTREALAAAFPGATGDLAVFVHGLSESDEAWRRDRASVGSTYPERVAADTSFTPVVLRVNTGLRIAENGVALAALLDDLVRAWPVPVRRIAFVGHSMGGLIVRAACAVDGRTSSEAAWNRLVTHVVTLGTPHLGAPLERGVALAADVLGWFPESAPLGRVLEYRSVGILDLRGGLAHDVRHLPHAAYHLVGATLAGSPSHPVSQALGDMLVRYPSAVGRPRRGPAMFPGADALHVRGGHFDLLNHPDVHEALVGWLT